MKRKRKGNRNEYRTLAALRRDGYFACRVAGSFGLLDVIGMSKHGVRLIQVKSNRNASAREQAAIRAFDNHPSNATKEVWIWKDYARRPMIRIVKAQRGTRTLSPSGIETEEQGGIYE